MDTRFAVSILMTGICAVAVADEPIPVETIERAAPPPTLTEIPAPSADPTAPRQIGRNTVEEFRVDTRLTGLRVKPDNGPAYYFEDRIGDGSMDESSDSLETDINMRKWRIGNF